MEKCADHSEIATATADIQCRDRHRVAEVWHEAEVSMQNRLIAENRTALEADRKALRRTVRTARRILGTT
jgi:hypothetical protein